MKKSYLIAFIILIQGTYALGNNLSVWPKLTPMLLSSFALPSYSFSANFHSGEVHFKSFSFGKDSSIRFANFHGSKLTIGIDETTPFDDLVASILGSSDPQFVTTDSEENFVLTIDYKEKVPLANLKWILKSFESDGLIHTDCLERSFDQYGWNLN